MNIQEMGDRTVREKLVKIDELKDNLKLALLLLALLAVVSVYFLLNKNRETRDIMESQRVLLQDKEGGQKYVVALNKFGPTIRLRNQGGKTRASLHVESDKTHIFLKDQAEKNRISLVVEKSSPLLTVVNEKGEKVLHLALDNIGPYAGFPGASSELQIRPLPSQPESGVEVIDSGNKPKIRLRTDALHSSFSILTDSGKENTFVSVRDNLAELSLLDENGKVRVKGIVEEGEANLLFFDSLGRKRAELTANEGANGLLFFDDAEVARQALALAPEGTNFKLLDLETASVAETELVSTIEPAGLISNPAVTLPPFENREPSDASLALENPLTP